MSGSRRAIGRASLAIMTRAPVPGETKTRLIPAVGAESAAKLAESFFLDTMDHAHSLPGFDVSVWVAGAIDHPLFANLGAHVFAQQGGDLGARMEHALQVCLQSHAAALLIGSDSPNLPPAYLLRAKQLLQASQDERFAVLGPSADGGFYLIGATGWKSGALDGVRWSQQTTFEETARALKGAGFSVSLLPPWYDVDAPAALSLLRAHLGRRAKSAPKTASLLKSSLFSWRGPLAAPY